MSPNSQWFQTCRPSELKVRKKARRTKESLLRRTFFNFDSVQVWNHWELGDIMYLILKVQSVTNDSEKLKGVTPLSPYTTPFCKRPFYTKKGNRM